MVVFTFEYGHYRSVKLYYTLKLRYTWICRHFDAMVVRDMRYTFNTSGACFIKWYALFSALACLCALYWNLTDCSSLLYSKVAFNGVHNSHFVAFLWILSMPLQITRRRASKFTYWATEWFYTSVYIFVVLQTACFCAPFGEFFVAFGTVKHTFLTSVPILSVSL